jgi:hypothetical protein
MRRELTRPLVRAASACTPKPGARVTANLIRITGSRVLVPGLLSLGAAAAAISLADTLIKMSDLPCSWAMQRQCLGFARLS